MCRKCDSYQGHHQAINTHRYLKINLLKLNMSKNIGLFWLRDDFRLKRNLALAEATKKTMIMWLLFIYLKKKKFENQAAQKWWVGKSLECFRKKGLKIII